MLYNRFLAVRFKDAGMVIGGRQTYNDGQVSIPPTIEFDCSHTNQSSPNEATIKLYNVSPETQRRLFIEGKRVEVEAGYWPQDGERITDIIFKGKIREVRGRVENGTDAVSELIFGDGDDAKSRKGRKQFARGTTHGDLVRYVGSEMAKDGIEYGQVEIPHYVEPRAITLDKPVWRFLDDICHQHDLAWSIQDGTLNIIAADKPLRDTPVVLTPLTGVIDAPEFTTDGVDLKIMMLPYLRPGYTFILRNDQVTNRAPEKYRIEEINFSGSNVGDDFGAEIKAKVVQPNGRVKKKRDRGRRRAA